MATTTARWRRRPSAKTAGILFLAAFLAFSWALFSKDRIATFADRGTTVEVQFADTYKLRPFVSRVKVGYVPVGRVSGIERQDDGTAVVKVKVNDDAMASLGSEPSARIRPTTILGGAYFVDLIAGGDPGEFDGERIPMERTDVPVELDKVAATLQPSARQGIQQATAKLDEALDKDGTDALQRLLREAPGALEPTAKILEAATGAGDGKALTRVVSGFEATSRVLTANDGQLDRLLVNTQSSTSSLADSSSALGDALGRLPGTLAQTRAGLDKLSGTLTTVESVSKDATPIAAELSRTLKEITPVLGRSRPVVADLREVLVDARPVISKLVPSADAGTQIVQDVRGPVINRVNGPVTDWLYDTYDGTGPYSLTKSDRPMYEEIAYALVNVDRASGTVDGNGHAIAFQPGAGSSSIGGLPISLEQYTKALTAWTYPDRISRTAAGNPLSAMKYLFPSLKLGGK